MMIKMLGSHGMASRVKRCKLYGAVTMNRDWD